MVAGGADPLQSFSVAEEVYLSRPSEGAVLCSYERHVDAFCRLLEEIPKRKCLIALVHFCYAIKIEVPHQSPA